MALANSCNSIRLGRAGRRRCNFNAAIAATLLFLGSIELPAQTNVTAASGHFSNRFLFIVETSRAMRPRAQAVFDAMKQALDSSLNGQIHQGDLVGIWTFNESIYQELFPSQKWSQPTQLAFAVRLPTFADPEIYVKRARLEKVIPEMLKVVSETENVTIIFVSSGEGLMQETPFSAQINSAWKEWRDEQAAVRMPILTVLRTRNGQPLDWLLTPAPRPINLPALAVDSKTDEAVSNPRGVVLESGPMTNKPESATLAPEQQVAFSIWALGKTSLINPATNPPRTLSKLENPAQPQSATPSVSGTPPPPENQASKLTNVAASIQTVQPEQTKPLLEPPKTGEADKNPIPESQVSAGTPNNPPADVAKHGQSATVTNAPVPPSIALEPAVTEARPADTAAKLEAPTQPKEFASGQQLLAHARAANPDQEKGALETDTTTPTVAPQRSFLRENIKPLVLMMVGIFGAAYCFKNWFLSQARITRTAVSLAQAPDEFLAEEKKTSIRPRAAA